MIFEFEGCVWFNGSDFEAIPESEPEWPSVEILYGNESFAELWLGQAESACAGASRRSRRVMLRFLLNELVKQAVAEFVESYQTWRTDADVATTHDLVRRLELWLTDICQQEL
jgi:hypothetical protein